MRNLVLTASAVACALLVLASSALAGKPPPAPKGPDPAMSTVTVDRTTAAANGAVTVTVTITALDAKGHPVPKWNAELLVSGSESTLVQAGATDKRGVATAQLSSTVAETKTIFGVLSKDGATVSISQHAQVDFIAVQAIAVQIFRSHVDAGTNCFDPDLPPSAPSDGWGPGDAQPRGGYTTWVRAILQNSEEPHDWQDATGFVQWSVDAGGTGTTFDPASGRVTTGAGTGTARFSASFAGLTSQADQGTLTIADAILANLKINQGDDEDPSSPSFGPDPIYVAKSSSAPAHVTGAFTGAGAGDYCITWDTALSSNAPGVAGVDANGTVAGLAKGTATVTARKGATIADSIPVNVGDPEIAYLEVSPSAASLVLPGTVQLHAIAHYTDGTTTDVTNDPSKTSWFVDPIDALHPVLLVSGAPTPGLVTAVAGAIQGESDEIEACYASSFVRTSGDTTPGTTCSEAVDNADAPQYVDPATGLLAEFNSLVTIQ